MQHRAAGWCRLLAWYKLSTVQALAEVKQELVQGGISLLLWGGAEHTHVLHGKIAFTRGRAPSPDVSVVLFLIAH